MKKAMKRLSTLVLALVLAMALAVPMFAAAPTSVLDVSGPDWNSGYYMYNRTYGSNGTAFLNLEGNSSYAYNHRPVTRYSRTDSLDQFWYFETSKIDGGYKLFSLRTDESGNRNYALNLLRTNYTCDIFRETKDDSNTKDSALTVSGTLSNFQIYPTHWGSDYALGARSSDRVVGWGSNYPYNRWNKSLIQ